MALTVDFKQAERLDRPSRRSGIPRGVMGRDGVHTLSDLSSKELADEGASERAKPGDPGLGGG